MFPKKDSSKLCCNRSTCPKYQEKNSPTSSVEEMQVEKAHKETQMSVPATSSSDKNNVPAKTSEKSSEAYFDRNNENIKCKFCPSYSSKSSQFCSVVIRCPSTVVCNTTDVSRPHCSHVPQSGFKATHKCTCKNLGPSSSSSSSSLTSEHFPVKLKLSSEEKNMYARKAKRHLQQQQVNMPPPRPERLQPNFFGKCPDYSLDQFYSCSSDEGGSECNEMPAECHCNSKDPKMDNNFVILELLHEVVHLINKDNPIREEAMRITQVAASSTDIDCNKMASQDKVLPPTVCPYHHCVYCAAQVPPFSYPSNLTSSTGDGLRLPQPFVYDESFKDCSSFVSCICANISEICPRHGPLKMVLQQLQYPCQREIQQDVDCAAATLDHTDEHFPAPMEENANELMPLNDNDTKFSIPVMKVEEYVGFEMYEPCQDCLVEYDDEDPSYTDLAVPRDFPIRELEAIKAEESPNEEGNIGTVELYIAELKENIKTENIKTEAPSEEGIAAVCEINELAEITEAASPTQEGITTVDIFRERVGDHEENKVNELGESSRNLKEEMNELTTPLTDGTRSANIVDNVPIGDQSDSRFDTNYSDKEIDVLDADENELAKEKIAESRKSKERDDEPSYVMALANINQNDHEGSPEEMKFFIDSLILDLDAMDFARRKSQFEKNICKSNFGLCARESFPVTITNVCDLGATSLYVQWKIHDCCGIGGYEIYTDGYLTNRYYNSRHEAAVITNVDITVPHKIALVAQPCANDESRENNNKLKSLQCKTVAEKARDSYAELWTPSIFLYDPVLCKATTAPQIIRDNF